MKDHGSGKMPGAFPRKPPLFLVAGAKGAVGSTLAAAVAGFKAEPETLLPCLTTAACFGELGSPAEMGFAGWDVVPRPLREALDYHAVLPPEKVRPLDDFLKAFQVRQAPPRELSFPSQVERLTRDIEDFKKYYPGTRPVLVNLLPACESVSPGECGRMEELCSPGEAAAFPDLVYVTAAIVSGLPVVNFSPNAVEIPFLVSEAARAGVPLCGRDGKTGQTYLKVVLASALKARSLRVDGWYSLNILGNEDGRNLADPKKAAGKLANKTEILEQVLGYPVGGEKGAPAHKVVIDYYPPRGDAKEAWDVIDFSGLFGLPMSLRLNLLARDSILAAPLVIDLARWMVCLQSAGRSGLIPELGFYFKKPLGANPPVTFQDQLAKLDELANFCAAAEQFR